jgi:hypothetical protein
MIQFNLLPDVKLEYIKARRTKRMVMLVSTVVAGISITITVILFFGTNILQRQHLNNLDEDIKRDSHHLEEEDSLDKILTVQNQLGVLDQLHAQKPAAARLGTYLSQIVPQDVTISQMEVSFTDNTMIFDGSAPSLSVVNKFIDNLKFTTYKADADEGDAFSSVVLSSFGRSDEQSATGDPTTYQITVSYNPIIFNIEQATELVVPSTITTRSAVEKPASPFQESDNGQEGGQ